MPQMTTGTVPGLSATTCVPACTDEIGSTPSGSSTTITQGTPTSGYSACFGLDGPYQCYPPQAVFRYHLEQSAELPRSVFADGVSQGWHSFQDFAGNVVGFAGPILLLALFGASVYFAWFPRPRRKK